MRRTTTMVLVVAILGLVLAPAGRAEDEKEGASPAERAYRDAWWAETSAGALDRALDGYQKAVLAEGPAAVRAKALYRSAVVLERIGKTDDAIRALERLAKEFADEAELQAKARDRLAEWTAVDLRTNFQEWYERYKYSPEFQGRIVELVLELGAAGDQAAINSAAEELLTIGQASVPALEAHLDSSNAKLRDRAVDVLLKLGVPPHVRYLLATRVWQRTSDGWSALLAAPPEVRTRLMAELEDLGGGSELAEPIRAVLQGPSGWAQALLRYPNTSLMQAILAANPSGAVVQELCGLVSQLEGRGADSLAYMLLNDDLVPNDTALSWLGIPGVRGRVAQRIRDGQLRDKDAWRALVQAMNDLPIDVQDQRDLLRAFMRSLSDADADADLRPAVLAYERISPAGNRVSRIRTSGGARLGPTGDLDDVDAASRFLTQVVDEARDPGVAQDAMETWARLHQGDDDASRQLIAWAQEKTSPEVSLPAADLAGSMVTDATLGDLLKVLGSRGPGVDAELLDGLRKNRLLQSLTWGDERYLRLSAHAQSVSERSVLTKLDHLFLELHKLPERIDQATRLALKVPRRVWIGVTRNNDKSTLPFFNDLEYLAAVRTGFQTKWPHWPLEDRIAALRFFKALPAPIFEDEKLTSFLRQELGVQWAAKGDEANEALEREGKQRILRLLPDVGLAEVRQVFDLSTAEGALAAWATRRLPLSGEVYDALEAARTAPDDERRFNFLNHWQQKAPKEIARRALRAMATDASSFARRTGLIQLATHRSLEDVRLFERALQDPDEDVRIEAARALAGVYDQAAIKALVEALEDPSPRVRDRVLTTLEIIKSIEEKKEHWKAFAEGKR